MKQTYQLRGMASTLRMRTAISPGQWQPWTAVSPLAMHLSEEPYNHLLYKQLAELESLYVSAKLPTYPSLSEHQHLRLTLGQNVCLGEG